LRLPPLHKTSGSFVASADFVHKIEKKYYQSKTTHTRYYSQQTTRGTTARARLLSCRYTFANDNSNDNQHHQHHADLSKQEPRAV
jgi:hypothetical protein